MVHDSHLQNNKSHCRWHILLITPSPLIVLIFQLLVTESLVADVANKWTIVVASNALLVPVQVVLLVETSCAGWVTVKLEHSC